MLMLFQTLKTLCYGALVILGMAIALGVVPLHQRSHAYQDAPIVETPLMPQIEELAAAYVAKRDNAGLAIGVLHQGHYDVKGFGQVHSASGEVPDGNTLFEIGSVTKVLTGLTLAQRVVDGTVRLDDPICRYLPEELRLSEPVQAITLRHLATHTSGLPRLPDNLLSVADPANPYAKYKADDLYQALADVQLSHNPGEQMEYSNFGMGLLGHLLELKTGTPYERLVKATIAEPLAMPDTTITLSDHQMHRLSAGHTPEGELATPWEFDVLAPAAAFRSTAADLLTLLEANLSDGDGELAEAIELSQQPQFQQDTAGIGLAWQIFDTPGGLVYWHNGGTGGYVSFVGFNKMNQTGVVVLSNYGDVFAGDQSVDQMGFTLLELASKFALD
ncbi:beta-lactamase family protein [Oculatella sp. LEGE 06141]|uniref:serine hydrolase domain-containing protein n=1 Tax=Oculatella sp. LEGE 06141 TaxID=1828648 RepID=UPI0018819BBF|nr:serine hydrolase domain-containing protein [Oculatella sp. LEGE 06141]MBE9177060.1 beta-lactamase family protein [Oculatella sp. LEGE 06141]